MGTAEQRQEACIALDEIFEHYSAFGYEVAETDPEVERWLAEAEAVKVEMLKTYNQRRNNRRGGRVARARENLVDWPNFVNLGGADEPEMLAGSDGLC